jgi:hypothetical protein
LFHKTRSGFRSFGGRFFSGCFFLSSKLRIVKSLSLVTRCFRLLWQAQRAPMGEYPRRIAKESLQHVRIRLFL